MSRAYRAGIRHGFTLVELIIVIAIISILAAIIFVAIDPARRLKTARNSKRAVAVESILKAVQQYQADAQGALTVIDADSSTVQVIGTCISQPVCAGEITASTCLNLVGGTQTIAGTWTSDISPAGDFVAAQISNGNLTTNAWQANNDGVGTYIRVDLGAGNAMDFVGASLWTNVSSVTAVWNIQYSDDNINYTTAYSGFGPITSTVVFPSAGAHRYWRLSKTNGVGANGQYSYELQFNVAGISSYLKSQPQDPSTGNSTDTRYYIDRDANGVLAVGACDEEGEGPGGSGAAPVIEVSG